MAEFPALPLWTDAYLGDTMHLGLEEHGAYLKLLMIAWRSKDCCLHDDDVKLARMLGVTVDRWRKKLRPAIEPFWTVADGRWTQKRLSKEREKVEKFTEVQRERAAKRWNAKSLNGQEPGNAAAEPARGNANPTPYPKDSESNLAAAESRDPRAGAHEAAAAPDGFADVVDALHGRTAPAGVTRRAVQRVVDGWVGQIGEARTRTVVAEVLASDVRNPLRYAAAIVDRRSHALDVGKHAAGLPLPDQPDPWLEAIRRNRERDQAARMPWQLEDMTDDDQPTAH